MNRLHWLLCVSICVLVPGLAPAQQAPAKAASPSPQMAEDIEIMRRLLIRSIHNQQVASQCAFCHSPAQPGIAGGGLDKLFLMSLLMPPGAQVLPGAPLAPPVPGAPLAPPVPGAPLAPPVPGAQVRFDVVPHQMGRITISGHPHPSLVELPPPAIEGVYLKGYGVVFTLTLPPQPLVTGQKTEKPAPKPVSEWDRIRRQLHGEKTQTSGGGAAASQTPRLDETILKVLADNGRHFTQLADNEKLTVVVTFRGDEKAMTPTRPTREGPKEVRGSAPSKVHDAELLGDLALKRGDVQEAIRYYQLALNQPLPSQKVRKILYGKLVQAGLKGLMPSSEDGEVKNVLEFVQRLQRQQSQPATASPSSGMPYAQLVITVPKGLLDQGTNFAEFRRQASVEFRRITTK
jgi:hypothetical protein